MFAIFELISSILKYSFTILIYLFIFWIARLIYLDISIIYRFNPDKKPNLPYLKLINRRDALAFKVEESYTLRPDNIIGRGGKNEIVLNDPYISGKHARIWEREGNYYLEDLGSKNGSYLNGQRLIQALPMRNGDRVSLGQVDFLFVLEKDKGRFS